MPDEKTSNRSPFLPPGYTLPSGERLKTMCAAGIAIAEAEARAEQERRAKAEAPSPPK
jgi:hypothetical protein